MNRNLASTLKFGATAAAAVVLAALSSSRAYANETAFDPAPFVSTKSRAEVRAELARMTDAERRQLYDDSGMHSTPFVSTKTRAEVRAELMNMTPAERHAYDEVPTMHLKASQPKSAFTRAEARAEYIAWRRTNPNAIRAGDTP